MDYIMFDYISNVELDPRFRTNFSIKPSSLIRRVAFFSSTLHGNFSLLFKPTTHPIHGYHIRIPWVLCIFLLHRLQPLRQKPQSAATSVSWQRADPYYGHEQISRLCAKFSTRPFTCPEIPPSTSGSTLKLRISSPTLSIAWNCTPLWCLRHSSFSATKGSFSNCGGLAGLSIICLGIHGTEVRLLLCLLTVTDIFILISFVLCSWLPLL